MFYKLTFFKKVNSYPEITQEVTQKVIFNCLCIDLTLFYIEVFVITQAIIFLLLWPRRVKSRMLIKILNQFIQYFNARFWFKLCGCKVSRWKIQKLSLASWMCVPLWLHRKKFSISFSCLNPRLHWTFSLILDLYWLNQ